MFWRTAPNPSVYQLSVGRVAPALDSVLCWQSVKCNALLLFIIINIIVPFQLVSACFNREFIFSLLHILYERRCVLQSMRRKPPSGHVCIVIVIECIMGVSAANTQRHRGKKQCRQIVLRTCQIKTITCLALMYCCSATWLNESSAHSYTRHNNILTCMHAQIHALFKMKLSIHTVTNDIIYSHEYCAQLPIHIWHPYTQVNVHAWLTHTCSTWLLSL